MGSRDGCFGGGNLQVVDGFRPRAWPSFIPPTVKVGEAYPFQRPLMPAIATWWMDHPVHRNSCFQEKTKTKRYENDSHLQNHNIGEYSFASQHTTYSIKTYISESISIQPSSPLHQKPSFQKRKNTYLDLPKGAKWFRLTGVNSPSLRVFPWNPWKVQVLIVVVSHAHPGLHLHHTF